MATAVKQLSHKLGKILETILAGRYTPDPMRDIITIMIIM